jgi:hypothetical protein
MMMYKVTSHVIHYRLSFVQNQFAKIRSFTKGKFSACSLSQAFPTQLLYVPENVHITAVKIIAAIIHLQGGFCVPRCRVSSWSL